MYIPRLSVPLLIEHSLRCNKLSVSTLNEQLCIYAMGYDVTHLKGTQTNHINNSLYRQDGHDIPLPCLEISYSFTLYVFGCIQRVIRK